MAQHLTSTSILQAWEAGVGRRPLDRGLALLWAAGVSGDLAALPLAERDRGLLLLRAATFGRDLEAQAVCPDCGEVLGLALDAEALAGALPEMAEEVVGVGDEEICLRPLTSRDLAAVVTVPDADLPDALRARATGGESIPPTLVAEIDARLEAREAEGELTTRLSCTACSAVWTEVLDVVALVWAEVEATALRLFGEVAELAAAFGWAERDILALSAVRRQTYLRIARGG
ncbi:hypothetical protein [uncultured Tateyamaria sp.]|uniref:hypothetical protein n=1 Tax=uncultured Tateyamaria sp. TaxID=455651 RepID=UPI0026129A56|nr:hypothetical protein [uncultured Tateyamaria sp.]